MLRRIVGIDPGLAGGLGVLDVTDGAEERAVLYRTPTVRLRRAGTNRVEYDMPAMRALLAEVLGPGEGGAAYVEVVLEEQQAMPAHLRGRAQGSSSTFRTGLGYGLWLGLLVAAQVRYRTVRPTAWKRVHGLLRADKRASRLRCGERFPDLAPIRAVDEGPAEALLMAAAVATIGRGQEVA